MKVTDIKTTNLAFSRTPETLKKHLCTPTSKFRDPLSSGQNWFGPVALTVVEVFTDEGITGVGTAGGFTSVPLEVVETYLKPVVLGESPFNTELMQDKMFRSTVRFGRRGAVMAAISAVDLACWDIMGKALGQPVYNLLGGKTKERVRAYASRCYAMEDLDALAEEAKGYVAQGFTALKQRFGFGPEDGIRGMKRNVELIKTVREAVGDEIELAADAYMGWDYAYAIEMERRLREFGLSWIEEPFMPDDLQSYARFTAESPTRISMGEHETSLFGYKQLIDLQVADILQPDCNRVGGITAMKKICALAEAAHLPVFPHSNEAHNLHIIVSQSNCPLIEYFPDVEPDTGNELFWKVFDGEPRADGGYITPNDAPGLGITLNRERMEPLLCK
ncbi:MAG: L-rhamnonate dehydratase [Chthoniobacterales bacterium]|nr:L-rhamnonate dehydratase [Chthoniobacterales bacterium]